MNQYHYPVAIIGAGPIGIELAVCLKRAGLEYIHFDAGQIGRTMTWWPRNTPFFSTTERLELCQIPIVNNHQGRITGEEYLAYLRAIVEQEGLAISSYEPVVALRREAGGGFALTTAARGEERSYLARRVVLAIGDMELPQRLHIPGEDLPHVSHYFRDPHDYFHTRLLIVGGRNSAVEAALRCWRAGAAVTISYRRSWFDESRVKHWLMPDLAAQIEAGTIGFLPETAPIALTPMHALLAPVVDGMAIADAATPHLADFVLLATGFRGDQTLLEQAGVTLLGSNRVPVFDAATMESNVPGLYLAGTVAAGVQQRYTLFIENCHEHAAAIATALTGCGGHRVGSTPARSYALPFEHIQVN